MWLWIAGLVAAGDLGLGSKGSETLAEPAVSAPPPSVVAPSVATIQGIPTETAQAIWSAELERAPAQRFAGWLVDPDPGVRARAALAVGRLRDGVEAGSSRSLPPTPAMNLLEKALVDPVPDVRAAAAFGLGLTPGTGALLLPRLGEETDPEVRSALIWSLGKQGGPEAVRPLVDRLVTTEAGSAAQALGRMGMRKVEGVRTDPVISSLLALLRFPVGPNRRDAAWALARMGLTEASPDLRGQMLTIALKDPDPVVRAWLVRAWAGVAPSLERTPGLKSLLGDRSAAVRIAAVRAVGRFGCTGAPGMLDPLLQDPESGVRLEAIAAASTCMGDEAKLQAMLAVAPPDEQAALVRTLAQRELLKDPREWAGASHPLMVRMAAVETMADRPFLLDLALHSDQAALRSSAVGHLLEDAPTPDELLALLAAEDEAVVEAVADSLNDRLKEELKPPAKGPETKTDPKASKAPKTPKVPVVATATRVEGPLLAVLRRPALSSSTANACLKALSTAYLSGKLPNVDPGASELILRWLNAFPELGKQAAPIAGLLRITLPPLRPPELPALEEVMNLRSARIFTDAGELRVELLPEVAPYTVWNFVRLAEKGYYNGVYWHRVVPDFVVQTGDPRGDGWGGPGYAIPDELSDEPYARGTLGMALSGPDTGGSQWFITTSPQPHLDGDYTVFGRLTLGAAVADVIHQGDRVRRIVIERVPPVASSSVR